MYPSCPLTENLCVIDARVSGRCSRKGLFPVRPEPSPFAEPSVSVERGWLSFEPSR